VLSARTKEKEYTQLETSKIQAACGLTDAQWSTDLPELYIRMLDEGRTTPRVKALLEDLRRYGEFLQHVAGPRCGHRHEVVRITAELISRQYIFETLDARQLASLLWQIFMDARRFFSAGIDARGNLPQSLLRNVYNEVAAGIVQAHLSVPFNQLLGQDPGEASYSPEAALGPGLGRAAAPSGESRTYRHVPPAVKAILRGVRFKYPKVTIAELMAAHRPPLQ
jgi:hypothetical protein